MGSFYRSQHELIFVFKNGDGATINNVQLGAYGRNRTNVLGGVIPPTMSQRHYAVSRESYQQDMIAASVIDP